MQRSFVQKDARYILPKGKTKSQRIQDVCASGALISLRVKRKINSAQKNACQNLLIKEILL